MVRVKNEYIKFSEPEIGTEEILAVTNVLKSGWLTTGSKCTLFEKNFSKFMGGNVHSIAVNSATSGLHLALEAVGIKKGDEVIVPTMTFTATAEVVEYLGATVKFADIDFDTLNISIESIKKLITKKTKAIIPVHFAGLSCNMNEIIKIAKKYKIKIVEDAAHALPTSYKGELIGMHDVDATVFSFYANKTITTGEGGMVVTKKKKLAKRIRLMRLHGIDRDVFNRFTEQKSSWFYQVIASGFKYNLTDLAASIGIEQLKKLNRFTLKRQKLAKRYIKLLKNLPIKTQLRLDNVSSHSCHLFVIQLDNYSWKKRDKLMSDMEINGVGTSMHYIPLHRHKFWKKKYNLTNQMFPNAEKVSKSIISLPLHTQLSEASQDRVVKVLSTLL